MPKRHRSNPERTDTSTSTSTQSGGSTSVGGAGNAAMASAMGAPAPKTSTPVLDAALAANAEAGLGIDLGELSFHTGGGEAERRGAAATTQGSNIYVANAAVDDDGTAEPTLMAEELLHYAQQTATGPATPGANYEAEAKGQVGDLLGGRDVSVSSTGGATPKMNWDFWSWFNELGGTEVTAAEQTDGDTKLSGTRSRDPLTRETTTKGSEEVGVVREPVRDATGRPVLDPETGKVKERVVSGQTTTVSETSGIGYGSESTSVSNVQTNDEGVRTEETKGNSSMWSWWDAMWSSSEETSSTTSTPTSDPTKAVKAQLDSQREVIVSRRDTVRGEAEAAQADVTSARARQIAAERRVTEQLRTEYGREPTALEIETMSAQDGDHQDATAARQAAEQTHARLQQEVERLEGEITAIDADKAAVTPENAAEIADRHALSTPASSDTASESSKTTTKVDGSLADSSVTLTHGEENSLERADGSKDSNSVTGTASVQVNEGIHGTTGVAMESSSTDADGNSTSVSASQQSTTGLVVTEDGDIGVKRGRSSSRSATSSSADGGSTTVSTTSDANVTVTNNGIAGDASRGGRIKHQTGTDEDNTRGTVDGGVKVSGSGNFTVKVEPVKGSSPPQWHLVVSVKAGAGISGDVTGSGEHKDAHGTKHTGSIGVNGGASGSAAVTFTHTMDRAEASQYLADLDSADSGGATATKMPEFGLIDRMQAFGNNADEAAMGAAALVDSDFASSELAVGDSVELTLTGAANVGASGSLGSGGFGVGLEGGAAWENTRRLKVSRIQDEGREIVALTVALADKETLSGGGSLSVEGVSLGHKGSSSESGGFSATFHLDPEAADYDDVYSDIVGTYTEEGLTELTTTYADHAHSTTTSSGESDSGTTTVGAGGFQLGVTETSASNESITKEDGVVTAEFTGSQQLGGEIDVAGVTLLGSTDKGQADVKVDKDGEINVVLTDTDTSTNFFGGDSSSEEDDLSLTGVLATGAVGALEDALTETFTRLSGMEIDNATFDALVARAGNRRDWDAAMGGDFDAMVAWPGLGRRMRATPNAADYPEFEGADPARLAKLVRGRHLAQFISAHGTAGMTCVHNLLRNYAGGDGVDLGVLFEWPDSISEHRAEYGVIRATAAGLRDRYDGVCTDENGVEFYEDPGEMQTECEDLQRRAITLRGIIDRCGDFENPRAQAEMLDQLRIAIVQIQEIGFESAGIANGTDELDQAQNERQIREGLRMLSSFKRIENRRWAELQEHRDSILSQMWNGNTPEYECEQELRELYEFWITKIQEVRGYYREANTPHDEWRISVSEGGQGRNDDLEPDGRRFAELWADTSYDRYNIGQRERDLAAEYTTGY